MTVKKKIALIKPPTTYADWYKLPDLGISYISAYLDKYGFECKIFDAYFNKWSEETLIRNVINYVPDIIGLTARTHEICQAARIAALIKGKLNVTALIGGCHITALQEKTLKEFPVFDYGIYGEGEKTILELAEHLFDSSRPRNIKDIQGIVLKEGKDIFINEPRIPLTSEELDLLPFPSFDHYYGNNKHALAAKDAYYVLMSSRGCPYNCSFCMQVLGRKVRFRSVENILKEIQYAITDYGAHTIEFSDEIFLFNNKRTREILKSLIETGLSKHVRWSAMTRANMVDSEIIVLAKQSGCFRLTMGVESGNDEILKAIGKGITVEQIRNAVKIIKDAGIPSLGTFFIIGHPNETRKTIEETIDLATQLNTSNIAVGIMVPYPGTKIYNMAKRGEGGYRLLSENWSEYDKYGGKALEVKGLPYNELVKYQRRAYLNLYIRNFRIIDFFKFFIPRRHALYFFIKKRLKSLISPTT